MSGFGSWGGADPPREDSPTVYGDDDEDVEDLWCPPHGVKDDTFVAPFAEYTKEPGCTCTMIPSKRMRRVSPINKPVFLSTKPKTRTVVTTEVTTQMWSEYDQTWVTQDRKVYQAEKEV